MSISRRIARNSIVLFGSNIVSKTFTFLYIIFMARYLGKSDFGIFSFAFAFCGLFVLMTDMGLDKLTVREVARDKSLAGKYVGNFVLIKIFLGMTTFALIASVINIMGYSNPTLSIVYWLGLHIVIRSFSNVFYAIIQANEKMEYVSIGLILGNALLLLGVILTAKLNLSVTAIGVVFVIVSSVDLGYAFGICLKKFVKPKFEIDLDFWKESIKTAWPLGAMLIFVMFYFRTDVVMINLMIGDPDVGLYSAAYRIAEIPILIPGLLMVAIFPVLSSLFRSSKSSFRKMYSLILKYLFCLGLPIATVITLIAHPLVNLFYDVEYIASARALQVLIWASAIMFLTMVQGSTFVAADKQIISMKMSAAAFVLNILMNLILIPKYSYVGASIATVLTEIFGFALGAYFLTRYGLKMDLFRTLFVPLMILLMGLAVIFPLILLGVHPLIQVFVFLAVYAPLIVFVGLNKEERQNLLSFMNIKKLLFAGSRLGIEEER